MTAVQEDQAHALHDALFDAYDPDPVTWYRLLTDRLAAVEAAAELARRQRALLVAHLHDTEGLSYRAIAERLGDVDKTRVGQLVARGRQVRSATNVPRP